MLVKHVILLHPANAQAGPELTYNAGETCHFLVQEKMGAKERIH